MPQSLKILVIFIGLLQATTLPAQQVVGTSNPLHSDLQNAAHQQAIYRQRIADNPDDHHAYTQLQRLAEQCPLPLTASDDTVLVQHVGAHFKQHVHPYGHFIVVHNTSDQIASLQSTLLERTHDRFYRVFQQAHFTPLPLEQRLVCVLFAERKSFLSYIRIADRNDMSWSGGYYSARTNRVALYLKDEEDSPDPLSVTAFAAAPNQDDAILDGHHTDDLLDQVSLTYNSGGRTPALIHVNKTTHEAAHQLAFNSGLQVRGVMYPLWVSEGLATNFENALLFEPLGDEDDNPVRRRSLISAHHDGTLMPLHEFVALARLPVQQPDRVSVLYAQAWGLFRFLFQTRPTELRNYLRHMATAPLGRRSNDALYREFTRAFGPMDKLNQDWLEHLAQMK